MGLSEHDERKAYNRGEKRSIKPERQLRRLELANSSAYTKRIVASKMRVLREKYSLSRYLF